MAEREGFEPSKGVNPYTLSRGAPSTTRPSLRVLGTLVCQLAWPAVSRLVRVRGGHDTEGAGARQRAAAIARSGAEPRAYELLHRLERCIERLWLAPAGLRKIRPTSAASAHLRRHRTGQLAGLDARGLIRGHSCDQHHLARVLHARQHHDRRLEAIFQLIHGGAQRAGVGAVDQLKDRLKSAVVV